MNFEISEQSERVEENKVTTNNNTNGTNHTRGNQLQHFETMELDDENRLFVRRMTPINATIDEIEGDTTNQIETVNRQQLP
eukprot:CAMPEP_0116885478 /NCGR_PEP_ID=MMETSP0463-20121206/18836_1 /TAXON_ID=181622 /ORGANISM="Strombidinopsis sp, Strain SopsisLIS2011" /LENGTH=80 /DNA_ID=CAMNT_0004543955 /DNA_START=11 /DNA_END=253 /DNA_ORIENTATION=+